MASKQVKLERKYPPDLRTHFVTNIVVQHQPDFFTLLFYEVFPPPILGDTPEQRRTQLESLDHVDAICVARLIVTPEKMRDFAKVINDNVANYEATMKARTKQN